ncbi:MAG TPA: hypothetical protein VGG08_00540 [Solirubrobacteraceae bacterium]|jgi:hypothetical protein
MPQNDAISSKRLDGLDSARPKKPLKTGQFALTLKHHAHDLAFGRWIASSQQPRT